MYKSTRAASAGDRRNFPCGAAGAICCSRAAAPKRSGSLALVPACSLAQRRRPGTLGSKCRCDLQLDPEMAAARAHLLVLAARDGASSRALLLLRFSSCRSPRVASRRTREQVAGRSPAQAIERTSSAPQARAFLCVCCDQLKKTFFPCPALPGAAGFTNYGPICQGRGIACAVLQRMPSAAAGRQPPPRRGSAAGTLCAPQAGNFSRWGRRGSIRGSEGGLWAKI